MPAKWIRGWLCTVVRMQSLKANNSSSSCGSYGCSLTWLVLTSVYFSFCRHASADPHCWGGAPYNRGTELEQISSAPVHTALHGAPQTQL